MKPKQATKLCEVSQTSISQNIEILPECWSVKKVASLGGKRRFELYGAPGTIESRRRGGLRTQERFRSDAEFAKRVKTVVRKDIQYPPKSVLLAEFVGIVLGDGGIRNSWQLTISFNIKEDRRYAKFVQGVIKELFFLSSSLLIREKYGSGDIITTSTNLIEFLYQIGIKNGNKVVNQVDIPAWIWEEDKFQVACLRGLMDTDGSIYLYKYRVNGKKYEYPKLCFSNHSKALLNSVFRIFKRIGFSPRIAKSGDAVYIENSADTKRYFYEIGTHNPRYARRFKNYIKP